eukprot:SAG11_NODE_5524_length_1536_cov_1.020181_1_plen_145_part_00
MPTMHNYSCTQTCVRVVAATDDLCARVRHCISSLLYYHTKQLFEKLRTLMLNCAGGREALSHSRRGVRRRCMGHRRRCVRHRLRRLHLLICWGVLLLIYWGLRLMIWRRMLLHWLCRLHWLRLLITHRLRHHRMLLPLHEEETS